MQHVPQDLGGHDDHGCVRIVRDIAGEQADPIVAESCREVMELLIAQRLDRCGVETRPVRPEGEMGCELAHDRLPGSGGRADQDIAVVLECAAGANLEFVESEVELGREQCELRPVLRVHVSTLRGPPGPCGVCHGSLCVGN